LENTATGVPVEKAEAAKQRGEKLGLWQTAEVLLEELRQSVWFDEPFPYRS